MRTWQINSHTPHSLSMLDWAAALIAALGRDEDRAFAQAVLGLFDDLPAIAQCTVFVHQAGRPRTLSVADYRGGSYLRTVADIYARRFYALDGIRPFLDAPEAAALPVLCQQSRADIAHETYRHMCYLRPSVSERLTLLAPQPGSVWLSVNFYRNDQGGGFEPAEIDRVQTAAPLLVQALARHWALYNRRAAPGSSVNDRLMQLCPELTSREREVLCGILDGRATPEIAQQLGVQPSSVISYQKRAYQRLGISGQRQLFAAVRAC
ncbi:MAG: LuxR C-terminal-related transcriptional regulator [Burkholderiaceae bacterium]|jgi:DNA-binding CsgD family transcriptional regulator|nr:LuxR C-terminal-related transcriptional regulator [Burkholderiaceae bacterium]